jgi:hypothetical protein
MSDTTNNRRETEEMKNVYLLHKIGDDYHGGDMVVAAYTDEKAARTQMAEEEKNQKPCPDCGDKFWYVVQSIPLDKSPDEVGEIHRKETEANPYIWPKPQPTAS